MRALIVVTVTQFSSLPPVIVPSTLAQPIGLFSSYSESVTLHCACAERVAQRIVVKESIVLFMLR